MSIYIGSALAAFSIVVLILVGWRGTFGVYGAVGILITLIGIVFIKNPPRPEFTAAETE